MTDEARNFIADLLDRYNLKPKRGQQKTPAYTESEAEQALLMACSAVKALVNEGHSVRKAVEKVAKQRGIRERTLSYAYAGKR
jgi:hypothetical protein